VGLKILYRNARRPGEAGMKLVPDQSRRAAERKVLEELGFTVIEITSGARRSGVTCSAERVQGSRMNDFDRLLEKEIPRLRRYAFALTRNVSRADDLVQDTLVRAIAKQHSWQCGTNLRAWLFTIMHNQNVNVVRRSVREGTAVAVDDTGPFVAASTDPTAPLSLRDFDRALARIPAEQRQIILLIGLEGNSYEEAAAILDVPVGTVRSRLSRGRESLRNLTDRRDGTETIRRAKPKRRRFIPEVERTQNSEFLPA
jgi:RNA polymerase sigma-70 factor, ECF subfamily